MILQLYKRALVLHRDDWEKKSVRIGFFNLSRHYYNVIHHVLF